ncbi:MAG: hypothetical protein ACTSVW_05430 [Candidatus Njordarchaeales archaeon]
MSQTKTFYPFWYEKVIITSDMQRIAKEGSVGNYDYTIVTENTEDYSLVTILVEPSENLVQPKEILKKEFLLSEFDTLKKIGQELLDKLELKDNLYEFEYFVITPTKELNLESIQTKDVINITYGKIKNNELILEPILTEALKKELPSGIITILPSKGDPIRLIKATRNVNRAISLVRLYYLKLIDRYKVYQEITPKIKNTTDSAYNLLHKIIDRRELTHENLQKLAELSNELARLSNAVIHDFANAEANYLNMKASLETIATPSAFKEDIMGRLILNAWKNLSEKMRTTNNTVSNTYNTIRAKLQLDAIDKQTQMMELDQKANKYLGWIQVFTGATLVGQIVQLVLAQDWITFGITAFTIFAIYLLLKYKGAE